MIASIDALTPPDRAAQRQAVTPLRRSLSLGTLGIALTFVTGCGASMSEARAPSVERAMDAPAMSAPAAAAPPAPPAPSPVPAQMTQGFAPPAAPPDPAPRQPSAEALEVPAAPAAQPIAQAPAPAGPAPARTQGKPSAAPARPTTAKAAPPPPPPKPAPAKAPPPPKPAERSAKAPPANAQQGVPAAPQAPLLIYVGDMQMQVDDGEFAATLDKVIDIAESLGGYLAGRKDTSVQVRIPSSRFRESLVRIEKIGEVIHRSVTADDVSEQYSDLEGRLVNLKATRHRLQEFLARSGSMADMLQVGRELDRVAAEIEQIEGKMRFLRSRAAFSLVTVSLSARPKQIMKIADTPPPPPREADLPIDWLARVNLGRLLNLRDR